MPWPSQTEAALDERAPRCALGASRARLIAPKSPMQQIQSQLLRLQVPGKFSAAATVLKRLEPDAPGANQLVKTSRSQLMQDRKDVAEQACQRRDLGVHAGLADHVRPGREVALGPVVAAFGHLPLSVAGLAIPTVRRPAGPDNGAGG